ncbi:MAG: hypothetical protein O3A96_09040 [Proteobacteria bacterium]|nr:hypothetical protein [Pseudomonadota bacterium]
MNRRLAIPATLAILLSSCFAAAAEVTVARDDCAQVVRHEPAADVAYRPGEDAKARAVAPADLGGGLQWRPPETFTFAITIDPIDYQRRRQLQLDREALAEELAMNADEEAALEAAQVGLEATAESLATTQAGLEAEEAATLSDFAASAQTIVDNTGGDNPTAAQLTARSTRLQQLETTTFDDPDYIDIQERRALNAQAIAENDADMAASAQDLAATRSDGLTLAGDDATLGAEAAAIAAKGVEASMTVGTVTLRDGRAFLDGMPLDSSGQAALEAACREILAE